MNTTKIIESTTMTLSKAKRESSIQNGTNDLNDFSSSTAFRRMEEEDDEELGTPINIYREHQAHLEQDKKAQTRPKKKILDERIVKL
ncbi:76_t:CDS:2 [Diversispora eburnea]|uniref:76_t:CDS:1 n=1 Tax=Diversispora eburnea TaxID=1213867 RepID=A0A9N9B4M2_9GLOM|nr:76_t:CDS:2 [Diversispora eburnea]